MLVCCEHRSFAAPTFGKRVCALGILQLEHPILCLKLQESEIRVSPFDGELVQAEKEASLVTSEVCALLRTCGSTLRNAWSWRQPLHCTIPDGHSQLHPAD